MLKRILLPALLLSACASVDTPTKTETNFEAKEREVLSEVVEKGTVASKPTALLFLSQDQRRYIFGNIDEVLPTRKIEKGERTYALTSEPKDLSDVSYEYKGEKYSLNDFLAMKSQIGFIVIKDGKILLEHYADGHDAETPWISFSVTKSVTSMLIGAAIHDGYIKSVDEPIVHYLPRLRGTAYEEVTIKNVLQMASGVGWDESYANPNSDVAKAGDLNGIKLVTYLGGLEQEYKPNADFNYSTGETNLAGEILRAAIGNNAATYLSHKVWQPFGMEHDANWALGEAGGGELGGCCINATLRDYARLGLFALNDGKLHDGTRVLPEGWIAQSIDPSDAASYYGYLWWLTGDGSYAAHGIFNQQIYVDPESNLIIAAHGNAPTAARSAYAKHLQQVTQAIRGALK